MESFVNSGACPATHLVRMPQVTFETVWDLAKFNGMWAKGQPNPYVWSFEGTRSYRTHMFWWTRYALHQAIDKSE